MFAFVQAEHDSFFGSRKVIALEAPNVATAQRVQGEITSFFFLFSIGVFRDGENTKHDITGFPEIREKQKGKKHRRTDLVNFEHPQGMYAYVFFLFVFHEFPEIQYLLYFLRPYAR